MATTSAGMGERTNRLAMNRLGLWLFFLSESFLFSALITVRYYLQGVQRPADLNLPLGFAISFVLILSSLTAYRAETAISHGNEKMFRRNVFFTIALGCIFLAGVGQEWSEGFRSFPPSAGYGTVFFTLTGFHALHVFSGLLALAALVLPGQKGRFTARDHWGVEAIVKYWAFIDLIWLFIFFSLYLVS